MNLRRVVAPASAPVTLAEAKAHLRVTASTEDTLIGALVEAATQHLDGWQGILGRALVQQSWELTLDAFPADEEAIRIPLPPVSSVVSVTYLDAAGAQQTMPPGDYVVDTLSPDAWITLAAGETWPDTLDRINAVTVRFVTGYGAAADVPAPIRAAILLIIGDLYANREGQSDRAITVNPTVDNLLRPYRVFVV